MELTQALEVDNHDTTELTHAILARIQSEMQRVAGATDHNNNHHHQDDKNESGEYQQQQHHKNNESTGNLKNLCKLPWAKRWLKPCKDDEQQEQQQEEKKSLNDDIMYWE